MTDQPTAFKVLTATTSGSVTTPEELDAILAESTAATDDPQWIYLSGSPDYTTNMLAFGIGRDYSFLYFDHAYVPGDLAPDDENGRWWSDGSQGGIQERGTGIPTDMALEAAHEFVRTGQRPALPEGYEWVDPDS